jgi:hypothetical protein
MPQTGTFILPSLPGCQQGWNNSKNNKKCLVLDGLQMIISFSNTTDVDTVRKTEKHGFAHGWTGLGTCPLPPATVSQLLFSVTWSRDLYGRITSISTTQLPVTFIMYCNTKLLTDRTASYEKHMQRTKNKKPLSLFHLQDKPVIIIIR